VLSWLLAFALPLLAVAALVGAVVSALTTEHGTARLLGWVPRLTVVEPQGPLLGDFSARRVHLDLSRPGREDDGITLEGLAWRGLHWSRADAPGAWLALRLEALDIDRLVLRLPPGQEAAGPRRAPQDLALPLQLQLDALRVGELQLSGLGAPVLDLRATAVALGDDQGRVHRIDALSLDWDRLRLQGQAAVGTRGDLPLQARFDLAQRVPQGPTDGPAWSAQVQADGPLAQLPVQATLQAAGQSLQAQATLTPFAAWPLDTLDASFEALDLSALASAAPSTALSGTAQARLRSTGTAGAQPIELNLQVINARADRWDSGRLPLRRAQLRARSVSLDPDEGVVLESFELSLGSPQRDAGRVRGEGRWAPAEWRLALEVASLDPSGLDARAPGMRLSGPLTLASVAGREPQAVQVQARLSGRQGHGPAARIGDVALELAGEFSAVRSQVESFVARSGPGELRLQGEVAHAPGQPLQTTFEGRWQAVDPQHWWPGLGPPPAAGAHRLNGQAEARLTLPQRTPREPGLAWVARWEGEARVSMVDSQFAGQPLRAQARWQGRNGSTAPTTEGELALADNRLAWQGELPAPRGRASDAALALTLQAAHLERLAPVLQALRIDAPVEGRLNLEGRLQWAAAQSAWPQRVEGQLAGQGLRWGDWRLAKAEGRWALSPEADAMQQLALDLQGLQHRERRIDTTAVRLDGSVRSHRLRIEGRSDVVLPWAPPATQGAPVPAQDKARAVQLLLQLDGRAELPPGGAVLPDAWTGWQAQLRQFVLGPAAPGQQPWVQMADVPVRWEGGDGALQRLSLGAGQAHLRAGRQQALLRWDELLYQAARGSQAAVLQAHAWLDPVPVAPLLREFQPDFGWKGDLEVGASLRLRSAPSFQADLEIARVRGDLEVEEAGQVERLQLTELRLALQARDGLWRFTQDIAGANLGRLRGEQTAQAAAQDWMPGPMAPLRGRLQADVDNLGAWAAWVPAGWRLGGQMQVRAELGGRLGAPEYTGEVRARDVVARNLLQGIHLQDVEAHLVLQGQTARIETLRARGGEGEVRVSGGATFGTAPRAELRLQAERFVLLSRIDRRITVSGNADVVLETERLQANGRFRIDEGLIDISRSDAPSLSNDVVVRRTAIPADEPPRRAAAPRRAVVINLQLDAGDRLRLRGRGLDTRLAGALRLSTPGGRPTLNGDIRAVDGTYAAYGQKLTIEKGVISFVGDPSNPRLDIEAVRPNLDIRVGVAITGTADNPRVRLFSEPEMSETDKLSWLVLGRGSGQLARAEAALLQRAVLALVSGEGDSPAGEFTSLIGLDDISVRQEDSAGVAETIVSLGKQISQRWYVGYERSLNATSGKWQLIYRIAQRFTVRAQAGADENALDFIWIWRW
jgi:translocation and assembly module TamB